MQVLSARVARALPTEDYRSTALRIVDALAVHRLTTEDIDVPIGPSLAELRDDLMLLPPGLPELDSFFLQTTVGSIVEEIIRTVSGQFITLNDDNGQVYLDVRKDIDYDRQNRRAGESLDGGRLDEAYFRGAGDRARTARQPLRGRLQDLGLRVELGPQARHPTGVPVHGRSERAVHRAAAAGFLRVLPAALRPARLQRRREARRGVLPAQGPPRRLHRRAAALRGAVALEAESTGQHRAVYAAKHERYLRDMASWLRAHMGDAVTITHRGETTRWDRRRAPSRDREPRSRSESTGSPQRALAAHFEDRTRATRPSACR